MRPAFLAFLFSLSLIFSSWAADTLAVMNFKVNKLDPEAGEEIADLISALLSASDLVQIVERSDLKKLLKEQELGQLGFSDENTSAKVQKLFGAKFFVTGKFFLVGKKLYITANLISTETSLKKTILAKAPISDDYATLAESAAEKIIAIYAKFASEMKPKKEVGAVKEIKAKVGKAAWPRFAVEIKEQHLERKIPDPAAQTEFIFILQKLGADVSEYKQTIESELLEGGKKEITLSLDKTDILLTGEGFSTYASRRGDLVSCKARIEIKATVAKTGKLLAVSRETAAGIDASEPLAAKKSLQLCADKLARSFLPEVLKAWKARDQK